MGAVTKLFVLTLLAIVRTNEAYVEGYLPMDLTKYQDGTTEVPDIPAMHDDSKEMKISKESQESNESKDKKETSNEEPQLIDSKSSEDNGVDRKKKSATTTFCVEIRPSDPYQKPFQVCEPAHPGYKAPTHQEHPIYHHQPSVHHQQPYYPNKVYSQPPQVHRPIYYEPHRPQYTAEEPDYSAPKKPQTGYAAPPSYGQQPSRTGGNYKPLPIAPEYRPPSVMVVPHVPVAEPYHVPQPPVWPGSGYPRTSSGRNGWDLEEGNGEGAPDVNVRSAYGSYESHEPSYGHGKSIFKFEKEKKIDYLPVMVKTMKKTKPLKFLKVYKDIKKGKLKLYGDEYEGDEYGGHGGHGYGGHEYGGHEYEGHGGHEYGGHGGHEYEGHGGHEYGGHGGHGGHEFEGHGGHEFGGHGGHEFGGHEEIDHHESDFGHHAGGNQHGLVITCQPSAAGYVGDHTQVELQRHMDLLKNIYSASEKIYANGHKTELGDVAHSTGVATSISNGNGGGYVPPGTYRKAGEEQIGLKNWDQAAQTRSSNGEMPNNWEANAQMNMNMNENVGKSMNIPSSAQPMLIKPTENVQKQLDTTASFRSNRFQANQGAS